MAADLGISVVGIGPGMRVSIRDLIHPNLNEPLKSQQQVTFKLVKTGELNFLYFFIHSFIHANLANFRVFLSHYVTMWLCSLR